MSKLWLLFSVVLTLQASRACDSDEQYAARDNSADYFAYGLTPNAWYYRPQNSPVSDYDGQYQGRTPLNRQQPDSNLFRNYFNKNNVENNQVEERLFGNLGVNLLNAGIFNNRFTSGSTFRPFANFGNRLPIVVNPDFASPLATFDSCTAPTGESGICTPGAVCSLFGGRPSGSCLLGAVCCVNVITTCGGTVTLNNTFWQSPATAVSAPSTCALTVKLDTKFVEQKKAICQVRLDFVSFAIAQPSTAVGTIGTCTDTFQVGGALNTPPTICGDNNGQHMYLEVPSSLTNPTALQLMFNFGTTIATRSWNIKISMLPCGASYLAPVNCLQYFTSASGTVSSFNWKDIAGTRQLNSQNYNICFRTELISQQKATQMCLSVCTVTNGGDAFSLTTVPPAVAPVNPAAPTAAELTAINAAALLSAIGTAAAAVGVNPPVATCQYDFLLVAGAADVNNIAADRFCGNAMNPAPAGNANNIQICTSIKPFRITYGTDSTEAAVVGPPSAPADTANTGFCLSFQER